MELPWLPQNFYEKLLALTNALSAAKKDYLARAEALRHCSEEVAARCQQDGLYGENPISEAFIRQNDEPGRNWNMEEWNQRHESR